jgi:hypothetical protein
METSKGCRPVEDVHDHLWSPLWLQLLAVVVLSSVGTGCQTAPRNFLINTSTVSPVLQIKSPKTAAGDCADTELHLTVEHGRVTRAEKKISGRTVPVNLAALKFYDRAGKVTLQNIGLGTGNPTRGPVKPVVGADGLLWLCREDEDEQVCICIPWFPD